MDSLVSFVPSNLFQQLLLKPDQPPTNFQQRLLAVGLFADISGFTALSEALSLHSKKGTEELKLMLDRYFSEMVELVHSFGGIVAGFGGDALTVLFPFQIEKKGKGQSNQSLSETLRRALFCALKMQARMAHYKEIPTSAGKFSLGIKIGLGAGPVLCLSVGEVNSRLEFLFAGPVLDECSEAEQLAKQGEIVLPERLVAYAGKGDFLTLNQYFSRSLSLKEAVEPVPPAPLAREVPPALKKTLRAYLHSSIVRQIEKHHSDLIAEHRKVTTIFTRFTGFEDIQSNPVIKELQSYLGQVIKLVNHYDGYLHQIEMEDKGSKYIVCFGAPLAHEDDEERALLCAVELKHLALSRGITTHTGISTGRVYCGLVGPVTLRSEYSIIGDAVNLAARLMQNANSNQILVSETIRQGLENKFNWQELAPLQVKGKAQPVPVTALLEHRVTTEPSSSSASSFVGLHHTPMVGREPELSQLTALLKLALAGQGQIAGITAEAGMGKSRLVAELLHLAHKQEIQIYQGECLSYATTTPYLVWRSIFESLFGLNPEATPHQRLEQLRDWLNKESPHYLSQLPLLQVMLGLPLSDSDQASELLSDPKLAKTLREALLVELLQLKATKQPLILVLEDCHWLDPLSHDLLEEVGRGITHLPVLIVLAYRPPQLERVKATRVMALSRATEISLKEFNSAEVEQLVELKLSRWAGPRLRVTPPLLEQMGRWAQGNPFYLEELLSWWQEGGVGAREPLLAETGPELINWPQSLQNLILSRVDRLEEGEKTALKVASVVGRSFKGDWLYQIYPALGSAAQVKNYLSSLAALNLILPATKIPEPDLEYLFRHILTRDTLYQSLALSTRRQLHGLVAAYLEQAYGGQLEQYLDVLAYHYSQTEQVDKQREYFWKAGKAAQAVYANEAAIDCYQRLLPLLHKAGQFEVLLNLAQVQQQVGQMDKAESNCQLAYELARELDDQAGLLQSLSLWGSILRLKSNYTQALNLYRQALTLAEALEDKTVTAQLLTNMGMVYSRKSEHTQALEFFSRALVLHEASSNLLEIARSLNSLAVVHIQLGNYTQALELLNRAIETSGNLADKNLVSSILNNTGLVQMQQGNYSQAIEVIQQSIKLREATGHRLGLSQSLSNLAEIYTELGNYGEGLAYHQKALELKEVVGDRWGMAYTLNSLGSLYYQLAQYEHAIICLEKSLALSEELGLQLHSIPNLALLAACHSSLTHHLEAGQFLQKTLERLEGVELEAAYAPQVYFNVYQVLKAQPDNRARIYLEQAYHLVMEQAGKIEDPQLRQTFLERGGGGFYQKIVAECKPAQIEASDKVEYHE